jgi:hypothetical protein
MDKVKLKMAQEQQKRCGELQLLFHGQDGPLLEVTDEKELQGMPARNKKCRVDK